MCKGVHRFSGKKMESTRKTFRAPGSQSLALACKGMAFSECKISTFKDFLSLQGPGGILKVLGWGWGLWLVKTGPRRSPFSLSTLSSVFFILSLVLFSAFLPNPFSPLQMACPVSVRSLRLVCIPRHRSFLPEAFRWAVPPPALPRLADRGLTLLVLVRHPLLPPVFSCFAQVLTPAKPFVSHLFSAVRGWYKEFSEMKFVLARSLACSQNWVPSCAQQILANRSVQFSLWPVITEVRAS